MQVEIESKQSLPPYHDVSEALKKIRALAEASEAHALLWALYTVGADVKMQAWIDSLMSEAIEPGDVMVKPALETLNRLYQTTLQQFDDEELRFDLLLPDDNESFQLRIDALAMWCQGFLSGLGLVTKAGYAKSSNEAKEAIADLVDVARLQYNDEIVGRQEEEKAYAELVEYTKTAVLFLQSEFGIAPSSMTD